MLKDVAALLYLPRSRSIHPQADKVAIELHKLVEGKWYTAFAEEWMLPDMEGWACR